MRVQVAGEHRMAVPCFATSAERVIGVWDINSGPGRLMIGLGFFAFVGFVVVIAILSLTAQNDYRRGLSNINPLGWMVAGFLLLLLIALVRS